MRLLAFLKSQIPLIVVKPNPTSAFLVVRNSFKFGLLFIREKRCSQNLHRQNVRFISEVRGTQP